MDLWLEWSRRRACANQDTSRHVRHVPSLPSPTTCAEPAASSCAACAVVAEAYACSRCQFPLDPFWQRWQRGEQLCHRCSNPRWPAAPEILSSLAASSSDPQFNLHARLLLHDAENRGYWRGRADSLPFKAPPATPPVRTGQAPAAGAALPAARRMTDGRQVKAPPATPPVRTGRDPAAGAALPAAQVAIGVGAPWCPARPLAGECTGLIATAGDAELQVGLTTLGAAPSCAAAGAALPAAKAAIGVEAPWCPARPLAGECTGSIATAGDAEFAQCDSATTCLDDYTNQPAGTAKHDAAGAVAAVTAVDT